MPSFIFATMGETDALFIDAQDVIEVTTGTASQTTVIYSDTGFIVTIGGRTLTFGAAFATMVQRGGLTFADNSRLYVGGGLPDWAQLDLLPYYDRGRGGAAYGGDGSDQFVGSSLGAWLLQGNQGGDTLTGSPWSSNTIYGGQGDDVIRIETKEVGPDLGLHAGANFVQGNKGNDSIVGHAAFETLLGGQGNDTIHGNGEDLLNGNLGDDSLRGSGFLFGEDGADTLIGGGIYSTRFEGGAGNDVITPYAVQGQAAAMTLSGGEGNDTLQGWDSGPGTLLGGAGNDALVMSGLFGFPQLMDGGDGDDILNGARGLDTLFGGAGADTIYGAVGASDYVFGGAGADRFALTDLTDARFPGGNPQILDWSSEDRIELRGPVRAGYVELSGPGPDQAATLAAAAKLMHGTGDERGAIVLQAGSNVLIFSVYQEAVEGLAGTLVGRTLADISRDHFI